MTDARVVLVRPHYPGNIGAVARAMHNFGVTRLVLVDPRTDWLGEDSRRLATRGEFILAGAMVVPDLPTALADCVLTAATSAKVDGIVRSTGSGDVRTLMPRLTAAGGSLALVFGPEPTGLTTDEIGLCHYLLHIPTAEQYPALNLAQAVTICLYEWHWSQFRSTAGTSVNDALATHAEFERVVERLRRALESIHFLYGPKAGPLMHAIRQLLVRAQLSPKDVRLLHGLSRQLEWVVKHGAASASNPHDPESPDNP